MYFDVVWKKMIEALPVEVRAQYSAEQTLVEIMSYIRGLPRPLCHAMVRSPGVCGGGRGGGGARVVCVIYGTKLPPPPRTLEAPGGRRGRDGGGGGYGGGRYGGGVRGGGGDFVPTIFVCCTGMCSVVGLRRRLAGGWVGMRAGQRWCAYNGPLIAGAPPSEFHVDSEETFFLVSGEWVVWPLGGGGSARSPPEFC